MKTEIIIAVRGEMPSNLMRTVKQAAAVAPVCLILDGQEQRNVVPYEDGVDGIRIETPWRVPRGCGAARDHGIKTSEANLMVVIDGHMILPDGWLAEIEAYHLRRSNHLTCCQMQSYEQDGETPIGEPQGAAFLSYKSREVHNLYWAISAKWNSPPAEPGEVCAIMGACYAFRRKWYETLGCPLEILRAWGGDEEILSIATHLMGGRVVMLPLTIGHIYKAQHHGRQVTADEQDAIWANRFAIVDAIPMDATETVDLYEWMQRTSKMNNRRPATLAAAVELRNVLCTGRRTWEELKEDGIVRPLTEEEQADCLGTGRHEKFHAPDSNSITPELFSTNARRPPPAPPAPLDDTPQVINRPDDVCERCDAVNSFKQIRGRKNTPAFEMAYARCENCGHKAQIRFLRH